MKGLIKVAAPASPRQHLVRTFRQIAVFWPTFLLIIPSAIHYFEGMWNLPVFSFTGQRVLAMLGFVVASALGLWSGVTMATLGDGTPLPTACARKLVIAGPYRYVRNPMAVAGLAQGACVGVFLGSWATLLYVAAGLLLWNFIARPIEEADLQARFGVAYASYCRRVTCWFPSRAYDPPHDDGQ